MSQGLSINEIAKILNCEVIGDTFLVISGIATLKNASKEHISFYSNHQYKKFLATTKAGCCLIKDIDAHLLNENVTKLICKDPYLAYAKVLDLLYKNDLSEDGKISDKAIIATTAQIGENCTVEPFTIIKENVIMEKNCIISTSSYIGKDVTIGKGTMVHHGVTLQNCIVGSNCIIHPGVRIGQDGFGFTLDENGKSKKIKQIGKVIIGDNVEIGANSCIDRGAIDDTIIEEGTKIDNLVQIGHNVEIGKNCFIAGQAAIAGSAKIGNYVMIGGQAGVSGHIRINDMAKVAGRSGVITDVAPSETVGGFPAVKITQWHKQNIVLRNIINKKDK